MSTPPPGKLLGGKLPHSCDCDSIDLEAGPSVGLNFPPTIGKTRFRAELVLAFLGT